ncbi:hypothetical protein ACFQZE_05085 [Paenibacillus sp. GCM10027627]|uniref:hypothetical protein n=1 Tax=unclassified Paenibacillus TaxID=185978 RepID=UPI003636DDF0
MIRRKVLLVVAISSLLMALIPVMPLTAAPTTAPAVAKSQPSCRIIKNITGSGTLIVDVTALGSSAWWTLSVKNSSGQTLYNQVYGDNVSLPNLPNDTYTVEGACSPFTQYFDYQAYFQ